MGNKKSSIDHCPHCGKHCPLSNPGCKKGREYARQLEKKVKQETPVRKGVGYSDKEEKLQMLLCEVSANTCLRNKELLLMELLRRGEMSEGEIKKSLRISKKELNRLLFKGEQKGHLVRVNTSQGKDTMVLLTERGVQKAGGLNQGYRIRMREYFSPLNEEDREKLEELLLVLTEQNRIFCKEESV